MNLVSILSGDISEGKEREFQTWLQKNEDRLRKLYPDGTEYVGTYFAVQSSEKQMGSVFTLVKLDNYAAQDTLAATGGELAELIGEFVDFLDQRNGAASGSLLLKRVTEASLFGS